MRSSPIDEPHHEPRRIYYSIVGVSTAFLLLPIKKHIEFNPFFLFLVKPVEVLLSEAEERTTPKSPGDYSTRLSFLLDSQFPRAVAPHANPQAQHPGRVFFGGGEAYASCLILVDADTLRGSFDYLAIPDNPRSATKCGRQASATNTHTNAPMSPNLID